MRHSRFKALPLLLLPLTGLLATPSGFAQTPSASASSASTTEAAPKAAKPVTNETVTAKDLAMTPLTDLNINKHEIPPVLVSAVESTYGTAGLSSCGKIQQAVKALDAVLGPDLDVERAQGTALTPGRLAKSVVSSFIPFDGIVREISGARAGQARMQLAIYAGSERRAFLKGIGLQRGCPYPARPLTAGSASSAHAKAKHSPH